MLINPKYERHDIKPRAAALGLSLTDLLAEANKRTGRRMDPAGFSKARAGKDRTDSAEQTLAAADAILSEFEIKKRKGI